MSKVTKSRKLQFGRRLDSSPEIHPHLPDTSSDMDDKCVAPFPSFAQQPSVNIHILVEFDTEPKMYYVGLVTKPIYEEESYEVSNMRRKCSTWKFTFLAIDDIASIKLTDIKAILPEPNQCGTTSRQKSFYSFCYDFHCLNVNWNRTMTDPYIYCELTFIQISLRSHLSSFICYIIYIFWSISHCATVPHALSGYAP